MVGPDDFIDEFYQIYKEEIILILYKVLQSLEADGWLLLNPLHEVSIALIQNQAKTVDQYPSWAKSFMN